MDESKRVEALNIEVPEESSIGNLAQLCWQLIDNVPDGGNTPQFIVGQLLETYHENMHSGVKVMGHKEEAAVTSTTSKKPADIMEQSASGNTLAVYEVTVKPFDEQRASDSEQAIRAFQQHTGQDIPEVIVVCREVDVHPLAVRTQAASLHLGTLIFHGLTYQFLEIHRWIMSALSRLSPKARVEFYRRLNDRISKPSTSEKVKKFWKHLHQQD